MVVRMTIPRSLCFRRWFVGLAAVAYFSSVGQAQVNFTATGNPNVDLGNFTTAMASAKLTGTYVSATGTFKHPDVLTINGVEVRGKANAQGQPFTIVATSPGTNAAVVLTGNSPKLVTCTVTNEETYDVAGIYNTLGSAGLTALRKQPESTSAVLVKDANNFLVDRVTVRNGRSTGIQVYNSGGSSGNFSRVTGCKVSNTFADGIHMTRGSRFVLVENNEVFANGDDMISVVSYYLWPDKSRKDPTVTNNIGINNNNVHDNVYARGISVIGGAYVSITNNRIANADSSGIYLCSERSFYTYSTHDVTVENNQIVECNSPYRNGQNGLTVFGWDGSETGVSQASDPIQIGGQPYTVYNLTFRKNIFDNNGGNGAYIGSYTTDISFQDNTIHRNQEIGVCLAGSRNVEIIDTNGPGDTTNVARITNCGRTGLYVDSGFKGYLRVKGVVFEQINLIGESFRDVITIENAPNLSALTLTSNFYSKLNAVLVERFIECNRPTNDISLTISPINSTNVNVPSLPSAFSVYTP